MTTKKLSVGALILIAGLAVSAFSWAAITRFNESQLALTEDLTSLNVSDNVIDTRGYFRHPELSTSVNAIDTRGYFRHPELGSSANAIDTRGYFRRPELGSSANAIDTRGYFRHPELNAFGFESLSSAFHYGPPGR